MATTDRDPFANTADAEAYVPRTATESVLLNLEMALRDGARVVCLDGPAGSGKTLLLRVLAERLAGDFTSLHVPYSKLDPDEFCRWGLEALGESAQPEPELALVERLARRAASGNPPLVWVIDDADLLPIATLHTLLQVQRSTGDALRLLLAREGAIAADEFAQAGILPVNVELEGEMDSTQMAEYVRARLDRAGVDPDQRARIEAALDPLYARSRGNPGRLHAAAAALLCFGPERLRAPLEAEESAALPPRGERDRAGAAAEVAVNEPAPAIETEVEAVVAERVSIESLVAEAVAAEPLEEVAIAEPAPEPIVAHTVLVAPPAPAAGPAPAPASASPPDDPAHPPPRKRLRLRRRGRH